MGTQLTLGAEEELHLVDLETLQLSPRAAKVLADLPADEFSSELQRSTVETNTAVVTTLDELRRELERLRRGASAVAERAGCAVVAAGTWPTATSADFEQTDTDRFDLMHAQYGLLVDEQLICGLQIHVGIDNRDLAVEIMQRVERVLPILLAASGSSPYWGDLDTGYSSFRTMVWRRWPSAGATGLLRSTAEYDALLDDLLRSGVISDIGMVYFDVRPSAHLPTLELRVCDATPDLDTAMLIAGLFQAAVRQAEHEVSAGIEFRPWAVPVRRAALWQASRHGLDSTLLTTDLHPHPVPARSAVHQLITQLRDPLEEYGTYSLLRELAEATLARGTSAARQRRAAAGPGGITAAQRALIAETVPSGTARLR